MGRRRQPTSASSTLPPSGWQRGCVSDVRGVRLSFRSPVKVAVASVWAAFSLAVGVWMAWSERADLWTAVFLGALSGVNLLTAVRIAVSRVWTEGCRLHVRNPIRRYTLEFVLRHATPSALAR
jgi:hypothetical protein